MGGKTSREKGEKVALAQRDQIERIDESVLSGRRALKQEEDRSASQKKSMTQLEDRFAQLSNATGINTDSYDLESGEYPAFLSLTDEENRQVQSNIPDLSSLNAEMPNPADGWDEYLRQIDDYIETHGIDTETDPFIQLLSPQQRTEVQQRIDDCFASTKCHCDKYDYMIASTCGAIGGLVDIFFVGLPGKSVLGGLTDKQIDVLVEKFAKKCGWKGARKGGDSKKSAIRFLEKEFKVNYDQPHGAATGDALKMNTKNHHIKSLSHSPDIVGLFFSVLNQFTSKSSFVDDGAVITIDTESFELQGNNLISKIYCGFFNWLGHLFSDMAGSNQAKGRGSGLPIPFFGLLQFVEVGSFGENKQTFATIAVKVFENGYDLRHGAAMAIPVMITEILIRLMWMVKSRFYHKNDWKNCIPTGTVPELNRMLLVGDGTLCLLDLADAGVRSAGDPVLLLLRMNLIGWVRLSHLSLKEISNLYKARAMAWEEVDHQIDDEYRRLLSCP